ncbi:GNAT family N-acetyltransferase [Serinicoccus kebangsaanensis]|uniref:GNAT family N-acetyltransferase n=1 Tax=Serinicoccus kebangsaanensis TaxID=2602069 RepID=UPI00178C3BCB|nr:GNAT family N-acetyltransferase [Serinicoccus kebangsaanensis]
MSTTDVTFIDLTSEDLARVRDLTETVWFSVTPGKSLQDLDDEVDLRHARGAVRAGGPLPGEAEGAATPLMAFYSAFDMGLTAPGPAGELQRVPMDGLTFVSVHPDARRRGVLRAMMTDHLHRVHDRGECAVAGLHASESAIYGRFGYGCASVEAKLTLGRGTELKAPAALAAEADAVTTHVVTLDGEPALAVLHEAHLACAGTTLGTVTRPEALAQRWFAFTDHPKARGSKEPQRLLLARRDGQVSGYAVFRRESRWEAGSPAGEVSVAELGARDDATLLALARRLVDLDLTARTTFWSRPVDDPVAWWSGGPRGGGMQLFDALWIRLVDVPRALAERGYACGAPVDLVLEVTDEVCPWNSGRWRLQIDGDGRAEVSGTGAEPDVVTPVAALGAAYLSGRTLLSQVSTLGVTERAPGAVRALSRAMRADREPVPAIGF